MRQGRGSFLERVFFGDSDLLASLIKSTSKLLLTPSEELVRISLKHCMSLTVSMSLCILCFSESLSLCFSPHFMVIYAVAICMGIRWDS